MIMLYKTLILAALISSVSVYADNNSYKYGDLYLGEDFNTKLKHQDISNTFKTDDGTIAYAFLPKKNSEIKFDQYTAYLTPISRKVAIVEFSKLSDSLDKCLSVKRFYSKQVLTPEYPDFKSLNDLDASYPESNSDEQSKNNIEYRFNPINKHSVQFGCISSSYNKGQYAFIVSFSEPNLLKVTQQENDRLIATQK